MEAQAVRDSRAGDAFHYRWAARRCLALIEPDASLKCVVVEGSNQPKLPGEYAIDLSEYYETDSVKTVVYYQLKHSTVRTEQGFSFSELEPTFRRFAERFAAGLRTSAKDEGKSQKVEFWLVTNRPVSVSIKTALEALRAGAKDRMQAKFERATGLRGRELQSFCAVLAINDRESNYVRQREALYAEIAGYFAGPAEEDKVAGFIELVAERALPKSDGKILREDVLFKLGANNPRQLFPAPAQFDKLDSPIPREQQAALLASILASQEPMIIHADGGVGKSVVARQLIRALPQGSWGLIYDCFGGGNYRNTSQSRHRAGDALVQMANEMAVAGLCRVYIPRFGEPPKETFLAFLERLRQAVGTLRKVRPDAKLVLFIDAADNAEMAAAEAGGDACFAGALLREKMPEGCRLVALCRTERIPLLHPVSTVVRQLLRPFSLLETAQHLRRTFPTASEQDAQEFHRLSSANPRVQANLLSAPQDTVADLLGSLGPVSMTSDGQIAALLDGAIARLKDIHPAIYGAQIEAICSGLANLPPFIPLHVLATVAGLDEATIRSFVSDLGRPLWFSDDAVQFRDEPTETWFNQRYGADSAQVRKFIAALEPLTVDSAYAARSLPQLLHRAGEYDRLIALALSEKFLPADDPINARDIRLYRLQFAFKAALQLARWGDACRLAFLAGEESAGDSRQVELLASHVDLVPRLQSPHRVQELAYRSLLKSSEWRGSASVHSAALLSSIDDFKGEARSYLRGAVRWLELTLGKRAEPELQETQPGEEDFVAFAWAHCNLAGVRGAADFFLGWKPSPFIFGAAWAFARRLVDASRLDELVEIARMGAKQIDLLLAATDQLLPFGTTPLASTINQGLKILAHEDFQIERMDDYGSNGHVVPAILSLCEMAAAQNLPADQILRVLDKCAASLSDSSVASAHRHTPRRVFLRGAALRAVVVGTGEPTPDTLLPKREQSPERDRNAANTSKELRETLQALLPWYYQRARLLVRDPAADAVDLEQLRNRAKTALHGRYRTEDHLPYEMSAIHFEVLALKSSVTAQELDYFDRKIVARAERKMGLGAKLHALRLAARLPHLAPLRDSLESSCRQTIENLTEDGPQERAGWYVDLARGVLPDSQADAAAYFDLAVRSVSRFGDEINERWTAIAAVGNRAAEAGGSDAVLTHRFIRCAEMVGRSVGREKYWDRDEVFQIAACLHLPTAFAALSRWRDRRVGSFERQLRALAGEAIERGLLTPACGWGLTGFSGCNAVADYAALCIGKETDPANRRGMLRNAFHDLTLKEAEAREFEKLMAVADEFEDDKKRLAETIEVIASSKPKKASVPPMVRVGDEQDNTAAAPLQGVDVLDAAAFDEVMMTMRQPFAARHSESFWDEVLRRVPRGQETKFLDVFLEIKTADCYDAGHIVARVRDTWLHKASVEKHWKRFLAGVGERFADDLADSRRLAFWGERWTVTAGEHDALTRGMIKGLSASVEAFNAPAFFGFIVSATDRLTAKEGVGLLDFALFRMEAHLSADFGDGEWSERLHPGEDAHDAVAGLVWSALGSPYSATRWEAAHCVRRWADLGCMAPLDALVRWMEKDAVEAYGSQTYPFYRLHARLYLLIALARVSLDHPGLLHGHSRVFAAVALAGMPHVLIQTNAARIALRIEEAAPGTYPPEEIDRLHRVGKSPFAVVDRTKKPRARSRFRGGEEEISAPFEQEFDWYWFDQISDIFDVSKAEVMEIARGIAREQFGVKPKDHYLPDPRQEQWNSADYGERGTSHSHGSYPRNDTYNFYASYHSFLCAASALLERVPVVNDPDGWHDGNRWADWVAQHSLRRRGGRWLFDRRDPAPIRRRQWVYLPRQEPWQESVRDEDFLDVLTGSGAGDGFLCVHGTWGDHADYRTENLWVQSALVNPATATALASSLRSAPDSRHFRLPTYGCDETQYSTGPFQLAGWILQHGGGDSRLDSFDPHAANIEYPSLALGPSFAAALGLSSDTEHREYRQSDDGNAPVVVSEVWSNQRLGRGDEPCRFGQRIRASLDLLKQLCRQSGQDLIFCVEIRRAVHHSVRTEDGAANYGPRSFKIFLFSHDGILQDAEQNHRLG